MHIASKNLEFLCVRWFGTFGVLAAAKPPLYKDYEGLLCQRMRLSDVMCWRRLLFMGHLWPNFWIAFDPDIFCMFVLSCFVSVLFSSNFDTNWYRPYVCVHQMSEFLNQNSHPMSRIKKWMPALRAMQLAQSPVTPSMVRSDPKVGLQVYQWAHRWTTLMDVRMRNDIIYTLNWHGLTSLPFWVGSLVLALALVISTLGLQEQINGDDQWLMS